MTQPSPSERLGSGVLCRGDLRVLFFGVYSQKGVSRSTSGFGLGSFWVLVDLFTGVVAPTTCSLTTCLTTCMCVRFVRILQGVCVRFVRILGVCMCSLCTWITPSNHRRLWITLTAVIAQDAPGSIFSGERRPGEKTSPARGAFQG